MPTPKPIKTTPLRERMRQDLKLAGLSERTQGAYVDAVRHLSTHYGQSPDRLSEDQLRKYFVYLRDERKQARSSLTIALCGIKFFYERTVGKQWTFFDYARPPKQEVLPVVLSPQEVDRVLSAVRIDAYRLCLTTIYACGLRLMEGASLRPGDIDSEQLQVCVRGKGNTAGPTSGCRLSRGRGPRTLSSQSASTGSCQLLPVVGQRSCPHVHLDVQCCSCRGATPSRKLVRISRRSSTRPRPDRRLS